MDKGKMRTCMVCGEHTTFFVKHDACHDWEYGIEGAWQFVQCSACGVLVLDPLPSVEKLVQYYPSQYHSYNRPESLITKILWHCVLRNKIALLKKLMPPGSRFLDVGCSDGYVIRELEKRGGWRGSGIEFQADIAEKGRTAGTDIYTGVLEHAPFDDETFNLIIMDHLLEHVTSPEKTMQSAHRLLKPGGYIVGDIPNTDSWDANSAGRFWGGLHTPRHLFLMNKNNLKQLAQRTGFNLVETRASLHTGHWAGSVQNYCEKSSRGGNLTLGRAAYYPLLLVLFIPINCLQFLLNKTGVLSFILQKGVHK